MTFKEIYFLDRVTAHTDARSFVRDSLQVTHFWHAVPKNKVYIRSEDELNMALCLLHSYSKANLDVAKTYMIQSIHEYGIIWIDYMGDVFLGWQDPSGELWEKGPYRQNKSFESLQEAVNAGAIGGAALWKFIESLQTPEALGFTATEWESMSGLYFGNPEYLQSPNAANASAASSAES